MHAGGQRFDSVILHHHPGLIQKAKQNSVVAIRCGDRKFFDILEEVNKEEQTTIETLLALRRVMVGVYTDDIISKRLTAIKKSISIGAKGYGEKKVRKSTQGMPWLSEAMKDVISCDKLRELANMNQSGDFRMGKPGWLKTSRTAVRKPAELKHLSKQRKRK